MLSLFRVEMGTLAEAADSIPHFFASRKDRWIKHCMLPGDQTEQWLLCHGCASQPHP